MMWETDPQPDTPTGEDNDDGAQAPRADDTADVSAAQVWDEKYRSRARIWSGEPNPQLIAEAAHSSARDGP